MSSPSRTTTAQLNAVPLNAAQHSTPDLVAAGREIVRAEGEALARLADRLGPEFGQAVELLLRCRGSVLVTGMGKAGWIGQKISATLASTGTRSHFLHPGEAFHGDLGKIHPLDVVIAFSHSGETEEVVRLLPALADFGVALVAVTGQPASTLGRAADVTIDLGPLAEVCPLGLAPSTSTTSMLAVGDALALVASSQRGFRAEDFARFHPGGSLGLRLSKVDDQMRPLADCRVANDSATVRIVLTTCTKPGRRTGAIMLTSTTGQLTGLFTDSDLVRLFENHREAALDGPIGEVMTAQPRTVPAGSLMHDALRIMAERKISELPVIDAGGNPVGLIDITDIAALLPTAEERHPDEELVGEAERPIVPFPGTRG